MKPCDPISLGGLGDLRRKVTLKIESLTPKSKPAKKRIYGFMDLIGACNADALRSTWSDFLEGKEICLPHNRLVVRTNGEVVPDREAASRLARILTTKDNPYLALSSKLDDAVQVDYSIDPSSVRVSYLKRERLDDNLVGRVLMKLDFELRVKLVKPLEDLDDSFSFIPHRSDDKSCFYRMAKAFFKDSSVYNFKKELGYFAAPCKTEQESNWRFALDMRLHLSSLNNIENMNMDLFSFLGRWDALENDLEQDSNLWKITVPEKFKVSVSISRNGTGRAVTSEDLKVTIWYLESLVNQNLPSEFFRGTEYFMQGGLQLYFYGHKEHVWRSAGVLAKAALERLRWMDDLSLKAENFQKEHGVEWGLLTGGFSLRDHYGVEFSNYDKLIAYHWMKVIRNDPLSYVDHNRGTIRDFAQSLISGIPYGS